jgi:Putative collagen-binding domain of a collagenase
MGVKTGYAGRDRAELPEGPLRSAKVYDLIPDQTHSLNIGGLTAYFGNRSERPTGLWKLFAYFKRFTGFGSITTNTHATSARTSDGSLVMTYMPTIRTVMVDMSKLAGLTSARWFDPTNGTYVAIDGSPFRNVGNRRFTPPRNNSAGDGDWVLVLEADARSE